VQQQVPSKSDKVSTVVLQVLFQFFVREVRYVLEVLGLKVVAKWEHGWRLSCGAALVVCPCCSRSILIDVLAILRAFVVVLSEVEIVGTVRLVIFSCCLSGCGAPCYTVLEVSGSTELGVQMATGTLDKA
jgi:hypothetical protein